MLYPATVHVTSELTLQKLRQQPSSSSFVSGSSTNNSSKEELVYRVTVNTFSDLAFIAGMMCGTSSSQGTVYSDRRDSTPYRTGPGAVIDCMHVPSTSRLTYTKLTSFQFNRHTVHGRKGSK